MAFNKEKVFNLKLSVLSFLFMDGFNNSYAIRSNDVPVNLFKDPFSIVHHWLHHK